MTRARDIADLAGAADAGTVTGANLIINGDMAVAQRGTSFTNPSLGSYILDRWLTLNSHDGAVDISQSTTAPPNFKNSLKLDVTTADTSIASGQYYIISQRIEGQNIAHLNYGSSEAKQVTMSFWVRSNKTGTYHVELQTSGDQELARQYTIDAADTWEYKTLTWIANTDHTITETNATGLKVYWWLAAGDDYEGSPIATTWANNTNRLNGQTNFLDSTSNEFYLTGVKLEVGDTATPFLHESFAENLAKCQRYFWKTYEYETAVGSVANDSALGRWMDDAQNYGAIQIPYNPMRTQPTATIYNPNDGTTGEIRTDSADKAAVISRLGSNGNGWIYVNNSSVGKSVGISAHLTLEAEL